MKIAAWGSLILIFGTVGWMEPVAPREAVASALELDGRPFTREIPVTPVSGVIAVDGTPFTVPAGSQVGATLGRNLMLSAGGGGVVTVTGRLIPA